MTTYYQLTPAEAFQRIRTQTEYDGPWHLLVQIRGHEITFVEAIDTTTIAIERAYALAQHDRDATIYIIVKPGDTSTFLAFQGGHPSSTAPCANVRT